MSYTRTLLEQYAQRTGWNVESMLDILCDYVDNQGSHDVLADYLQERVEEEESHSILNDSEDE